jgi:AraC family transcriptional regulator
VPAGVEGEEEVQGDVKAEGRVKMKTIPGGEYAVATHKGPYWRLGETYQMLYTRWLPDSGREPANRPCLERYVNDPRQVPESEILTEVCAPLV